MARGYSDLRPTVGWSAYVHPMTATRHAPNGDASIAYQVCGHGPVDLVCVPGWVSNVEIVWEDPTLVVSHFKGASHRELDIRFTDPG